MKPKGPQPKPDNRNVLFYTNNNPVKLQVLIDPVAAPRMTRSDKWKKRPAVMRYFAFRNELVLRCNLAKFKLEDTLNVLFVLPMPESWKPSKREMMFGKPHKQKPDRDNLLKAVQDAFNIDDAHVWDGRTTKIWGEQGAIIFY